MTEKNLQKLFLSHSIVRFGQVPPRARLSRSPTPNLPL